MENRLISAILKIKQNKDINTFDEASTKNEVVLRLLSILGWDPFNTQEVKPEYSIMGKRVDYSLRYAGSNKVFIEVKQMLEPLEKHQEQLLNYSFQEGVKLAILTNGLTWWFYLPLNEGSWEQRRFYTIDLYEQDPQDICKRFINFLSKENISSGKAIKSAEDFYKSQQKRKILQETIPKAWYKIISEPDKLLIELIVETTEKLCGFRPEDNNVEVYLKRNVLPSYQQLYDSATKLSKIPVERKKDKRTPPLESRKSKYDHNKPRELFVSTSKRTVRTWQDVLLGVCEILSERHPYDIEKFFKLDKYFSRDPRKLPKRPKEISSTGIFVETNLGAGAIMQRCKKIVELFGYSESDLRVVLEGE